MRTQVTVQWFCTTVNKTNVCNYFAGAYKRGGNCVSYGTVLHCPFVLTRLNRDTSLSVVEIARDVYWCLPKAEKGDTNKIQFSLHF